MVSNVINISTNYIGAGVGVGLVAMGTGFGIGLIGNSAMTALSKQPKFGGVIRSSMIIVSALIEGVSLFAIIICMLVTMNSDPDVDRIKAFSACIGSGIVSVGAGIGVGLIGRSSMNAIARQPEVSDDIRSSMIIVSALIEGVALFGVIICMLLSMK